MPTSIKQFFIVAYVFGLPDALARTLTVAGLYLKGVQNYQKPLVRCIKSFAKTHDWFIDIGAASGDLVGVVAPHFKRALAIEPAPHHQKKLSAVVNSSNNTELIASAMGDKQARIKLGLSDDNPDDNSVFTRPDIDKYIEVPQQRLDSIVTKRKIYNPVVKVDVQGYEFHILKGADQTLKQNSVFIMEFWPWGLFQAGTNPAEVIALFRENRYSVRKLSGRPIKEKTINRMIKYGRNNKYVVSDILAVKVPEK